MSYGPEDEEAETPADVLARWELEGQCSPTCAGCKPVYERVARGEFPYGLFAPSHVPSEACSSGRKPHCTCDSCF
mgnify:CR=1 FL=1